MRIGFLDFLRDLKEDTFAFTPYEDLRVEGWMRQAGPAQLLRASSTTWSIVPFM